MSNYEKLYNAVLDYGQRYTWISDLAEALDLSYEAARKLTVAGGYYRGKKLFRVEFHEFCQHFWVKKIVGEEV